MAGRRLGRQQLVTQIYRHPFKDKPHHFTLDLQAKYQILRTHDSLLSLTAVNLPSTGCLGSVFPSRCQQAANRPSDRLDSLHNQGCGCTTTVANSRNTILTRFKLVQQCRKNPRPRASQRMTKGYGTAQQVDFRTLQSENLYTGLSVRSKTRSLEMISSPSHSP